MPEDISIRPDFERRLEAEVKRILADPLFQRSPVLSRLLRYLCDQTTKGNAGNITQFAIAVDGLGRPDDYDQDVESYPRVQISRLRKALSEYYARSQPGGGLCVFLRHGDYALRLLPIERAYPDRRSPPEAAGLAEPQADAPARPAARWNGLRSPLGRTLAAVLAVAAVGAAAWFAIDRLRGPRPLAGEPHVSVTVEGPGSASTPANLHDIALREARMIIAASSVGRNGERKDGGYSLFIDLGSSVAQRPEAFIRLDDAEGYTIFAQSFPISSNVERFVSDLDSVLVDLFSPSGLLAQDLAEEFTGREPQTAFECQIAIETRRSSGTQIATMVDGCLAAHAGSSFAPYWLARRSFANYQAALRNGEEARRGGAGWADLVRALDQDRYNPFANALAAKIELAAGNCALAEVHMGRAMAQGRTYPPLHASLLADVLPCLTDPVQRAEWNQRFSSLIAKYPDPDPVLRVYLALGALEMGHRDIARAMLVNAIIRPQSGSDVAYSLDMLERAATGRKVERTELDTAIRLFAWNPRARTQILVNLGFP